MDYQQDVQMQKRAETTAHPVSVTTSHFTSHAVTGSQSSAHAIATTNGAGAGFMSIPFGAVVLGVAAILL